MVHSVRLGDYLEVAADNVSYEGRRSPDRLYYRVVWETRAKGRAVILHRLEDKPPLQLDEIPLPTEEELLKKWLAERGEAGQRISSILGS